MSGILEKYAGNVHEKAQTGFQRRHYLAFLCLLVAAFLVMYIIGRGLTFNRAWFAALFAGMGIPAFFLRTRSAADYDLKEVDVSPHGIAGFTFSDRQFSISWSEVRVLRIYAPKLAPGGFIVIEGERPRYRILQRFFRRFGRIRAAVEILARKNEVPCQIVRFHTKPINAPGGLRPGEEEFVKAANGYEPADPAQRDIEAVHTAQRDLAASLACMQLALIVFAIGWGVLGATSSIALLLVSGISLSLFGLVIWATPYVQEKSLRYITIGEEGIIGKTMSGKRIDLPWAAVERVIVERDPEGSQNLHSRHRDESRITIFAPPEVYYVGVYGSMDFKHVEKQFRDACKTRGFTFRQRWKKRG